MGMLFWLKPSIINVDCLTSNTMVYDMAKIEPANRFMPTWWKKLPKSIGDHPHIRMATLKTCSGFVDLYKTGFIMPMWCDLAVDIGPIGSMSYRYQYSDNESSANEHVLEQKGEFCEIKKYQHLKLNSPWWMITKNDINWLFNDVVWNNTEPPPYRTLPGIVNFKFVSGTNINLIFPRSEQEKQILIAYKTPIAHIVPLTEKKIKLRYELVDDQELKKRSKSKNCSIKFLNRVHEYKMQLKCPVKHN